MNNFIVNYWTENSNISKLITNDNHNLGKITFVGSIFKTFNGLWRVEVYNPDKDEYWIAKEENNTSPISAAWISRKHFSEGLLSGDIEILDKWFLPR